MAALMEDFSRKPKGHPVLKAYRAERELPGRKPIIQLSIQRWLLEQFDTAATQAIGEDFNRSRLFTELALWLCTHRTVDTSGIINPETLRAEIRRLRRS